MFGYIKPYYPELKLKHMEAYKACYCGLCHTLEDEFGIFAKMILNYDFVLLVMMLWGENDKLEFSRSRCSVHPCKKQLYCKSNDAFKRSAAMSIILAWWKFQDDIRDDGFIRALPKRLAVVALKGAYKKACAMLPDFDRQVRENLNALSQMEINRESSLDKTADSFARLLSAAAEGESEGQRRASEQTLYHIGRYIYIIDACDDLQQDMKTGNYNPVATRYDLKESLSQGQKDELETTIMHSRNLSGAAFELMAVNPWTEIVRNIIFYGMPDICTRVLNGTFHNRKDKDLMRYKG